MKKVNAGTIKIIENWEIKRVNHFTGEIIDVEKKTNLIVNKGLEIMAKRIGGNTSDPFDTIAIGTGITGAANGDTTLGTEYTRAAADTSAYEASYKWTFSKTFTFGSGVSEDITEAGILNNSVAAGDLLARTTFSAKSVSSEVDLIVSATITVATV